MNESKIQKNLKKLIIKNLKMNGVKSTDHLYLSIDMGGIFCNYINNPEIINIIIKKKHFFTKYVLKILKEYISKSGSLICPTFSYSPIKTNFFDIKKTKSDLGIFSQIFLEDKVSLRSDHSIHSLSAIGKFKEIIKQGHGIFSFGINSPFGSLSKFNAKFVNIGIPFWKTCTYIHHVQHLNGCNFRFYKSFKVKKKIGTKIKVSYDYDFLRFRNLSEESINTIKIEKVLSKKRLIRYSKKPVFFSVINCKSVYTETKILLKKNPSIFINGSKKVIFNDNLKDKNLIKLKVV
jgi:aminoglycoside 3-N-acetyltransferase